MKSIFGGRAPKKARPERGPAPPLERTHKMAGDEFKTPNTIEEKHAALKADLEETVAYGHRQAHERSKKTGKPGALSGDTLNAQQYLKHLPHPHAPSEEWAKYNNKHIGNSCLGHQRWMAGDIERHANVLDRLRKG